jgi:hypothetical protein
MWQLILRLVGLCCISVSNNATLKLCYVLLTSKVADEWVWPSAATSAYTKYLMEMATDAEVGGALFKSMYQHCYNNIW